MSKSTRKSRSRFAAGPDTSNSMVEPAFVQRVNTLKERVGNNFPEFSQSRLSCGKVS